MKKVKVSLNMAFTLAEVLITLGIIGVVAAMVIPTLLNNATDQAVVTHLKRDMTILQQAVMSAVAEEGDIGYWYSGSSIPDANAAVNTILSPHLKIAQNCGIATGCLPGPYKSAITSSAYTLDLDTGNYSKMILSDGTIIAIYTGLLPSDQISYVRFYIDTNGLKGPNRMNFDLFAFVVQSSFYPLTPSCPKNMICPAGYDRYITGGALNNNTCSVTAGGPASITDVLCTAWAIYNGNLDYKYVNDLDWTTKTHK